MTLGVIPALYHIPAHATHPSHPSHPLPSAWSVPSIQPHHPFPKIKVEINAGGSQSALGQNDWLGREEGF